MRFQLFLLYSIRKYYLVIYLQCGIFINTYFLLALIHNIIKVWLIIKGQFTLMKHRFAVIIILLFAQILLYSAEQDKACAFAVNLLPSTLDLLLGSPESPAFLKQNMVTNSATLLTEVKTPDTYLLYYKPSSEKLWKIAEDTKGEKLSVLVAAGKACCIVVNHNGKITCSILDLSDTTPAICFLNGSSDPVNRMEVGVDWGKGTAVFTEVLMPYCITDFQPFKPGYFSLFWQFGEQIETSAYYVYPDKSGREYEVFHFQKGQYYLFLAGSKEGTDFAVLFKLTAH